MIKDLPTDSNEKALLKTQEAPDIDKPAGIETNFHIDNGDLIIERVADVQNVLDRAANLRSLGQLKTKMGDHFIGTIPLIEIEKYCNRVGVTLHEFWVDDTHMTRMLNDPDLSLFRVWEGRV